MPNLSGYCHWFIRHLAGLNYRESILKVKPNFITKLDKAYAYYLAPEGKIEIEWERVDDTINLKVTVPDKVSASVELSDGSIFEDGSDNKTIGSNENNLTIKQL